MRFFARLGLFGTLVSILACCNGNFAIAQKPMDVASAMTGDAAALNGDWKNVDAQTRGLARVVVNGMKVHPYGACSSATCDWGTIKAKSFASKVDLKDRVVMLAHKNTSFDQTTMTISLEADGRLRIETLTHFTDRSRRSDYSTVQYFTRQ